MMVLLDGLTDVTELARILAIEAFERGEQEKEGFRYVSETLGLRLVELNPHGSILAVGRECRSCGAPMGSLNPDECRYIASGTCSDCNND